MASIRTLPPKHRRFQTGTHEYILFHSALTQNLRQCWIVPEAVHIGTCFADLSELFFKIALSVKPLPDKGLSAGKDAVRLNKPAACQFPPALRHALPDLLKHLWRDRLNPFKERGGGGRKPHLWILPHPLKH